jgi:hypothetical protein
MTTASLYYDGAKYNQVLDVMRRGDYGWVVDAAEPVRDDATGYWNFTYGRPGRYTRYTREQTRGLQALASTIEQECEVKVTRQLDHFVVAIPPQLYTPWSWRGLIVGVAAFLVPLTIMTISTFITARRWLEGSNEVDFHTAIASTPLAFIIVHMICECLECWGRQWI